MAYGMAAIPAGPGPAASGGFWLNQNVLVPQYITTIDSCSFSHGSRDSHVINFSGWDGQGSLMIIYAGYYEDSSGYNSINGFRTPSNTQIIFTRKEKDYNESYTMRAHIYKLWPQANRGYGMTFSNSSDILALGDNATVPSCIWAWEGTINNTLQLPNIDGYDTNYNMVFANFNSTEAGLYRNGNTLEVYRNFPNMYPGDKNTTNFGGSLYCRVVIFNNRPQGAIPHNGGFNIYSPNGQKCMFSTYTTPMLSQKIMPVSGGNSGVSHPMPLIPRSTGTMAHFDGNKISLHRRSIMINGSTIYNGDGPRYWFYDSMWGSPINNRDPVNASYPVLNAADYFGSIRRII